MDRFIRGYLALVILLSPLPAASNRAWVIAFLASSTAFVGAIVLLNRALTRRHRRTDPGLPLPVWLLAAWLLLIALQYIAGVNAFNGFGWQGIDMNGEAGSAGTMPHVVFVGSVYPGATLLELLLATAYLGVFLLAVYSVRRTRHLNGLVLVALMSCSMQALAAFFEYLNSADIRILTTRFVPDINGTFVNRNHLGSYIMMGAALAMGMLLGHTSRIARRKGALRGLLSSLLDLFSRRGIPLLLWILLALVVVSLAASRGAVIAFCLSSAIILLLILVTPLAAEARGRAVVLGIFVLAGLGFALGGSLLIERADKLVETDFSNQRWSEWKIALSAIIERPWFGYGLGATQDAFQPFRDGSLFSNTTFNYLHNQYLLIALEAGLVGLSILALLMLVLLHRLIGAVRLSARPGVYLGLLAMLITACVHALVEFNLEIPAIALLILILLGGAVGALRGIVNRGA